MLTFFLPLYVNAAPVSWGSRLPSVTPFPHLHAFAEKPLSVTLFRLQLEHERKGKFLKPLQPPVRSRIFKRVLYRNHIAGVLSHM